MAYFDFNATAPLHPVARETWLKTSADAWQNPGSPYRAGARAHARLVESRECLAGLLDCGPERIVFTSGATESDNTVIASVASVSGQNDRIAVSPTEHPAVLEAADRFWGDRVIWLRVDGAGRIDEAHLEEVLVGFRPRLTCIMAANNETGVVAPVVRLAELCRRHGSLMLCDATQWIGKRPLENLRLPDFLVGGAHKFGGPKGVGFLRLPKEGQFSSLIRGGRQENGHRAGTENIPSVAAMTAVLSHLKEEWDCGIPAREETRRDFESSLKGKVPGVCIVSEDAERLWNTVSVIMPHGENTWWARKLDAKDFQVGTGSACSTGEAGPSHVMKAQNIPPDQARRMVRLSSGWSTGPEDWRDLAVLIAELAAEQAAGPVIRIVNSAS
ncbi:MAG: cysteine desulfurase family protein [Opitutaceae bacterium]